MIWLNFKFAGCCGIAVAVEAEESLSVVESQRAFLILCISLITSDTRLLTTTLTNAGGPTGAPATMMPLTPSTSSRWHRCGIRRSLSSPPEYHLPLSPPPPSPVWAQPRFHHALKKQQVFEFTKQVRIVHLCTRYALCMPRALLVLPHVLVQPSVAHTALPSPLSSPSSLS
jgi:hypothetical protein